MVEPNLGMLDETNHVKSHAAEPELNCGHASQPLLLRRARGPSRPSGQFARNWETNLAPSSSSCLLFASNRTSGAA
jgi:hypothetical protein